MNCCPCVQLSNRRSGTGCLNWSGALYHAFRSKESAERAEAGLRMVEPFLEREPNYPQARDYAAKLHGNRALSLYQAGDRVKTMEEWQECTQISGQPVPGDEVVTPAIDMVHDGKIEQGPDQARKVKSARGLSDAACYDLGWLYALCALKSRNDPGLPDSRKDALVKSYIAESLNWLKRAEQLGFSKDPQHREHAPGDPDLEILKDRAEFRQLIEPPRPSPESTSNGSGPETGRGSATFPIIQPTEFRHSNPVYAH